MTSLKQISLFTEETSTLSQGDSLANHTQAQESDLAKKMRDTSGQKCLEQLEKFSRVGLWARTFADLLIGTGDWYSTRCNLTWKLKATKSSRFYFQLVPLMHHTDETASGLLPTPTAGEIHDYNVNWNSLKKIDKGGRIMRRIATTMLPTPCASDNRDRGGPKNLAVKRRLEMGKQLGLTMMVDGPLNPQFVEEMMGFPKNWTQLPFQTGQKKA